MDNPRCTNCRNPIKARHRFVEHPRTGHVFHDDCWDNAFDAIQTDYLRRIEDEGLEGLLAPYVVTLPDVVAEPPAVPEQRDEEQAEELAEEYVATTADEQVHVPVQSGPVERPLVEAETV